MPRSCEKDESRSSRKESKRKTIETRREPKLNWEGKREGTEVEAREGQERGGHKGLKGTS